jgi:integrase
MAESNAFALIHSPEAFQSALRAASLLWAEATTSAVTPRRADLLRDKQQAVQAFFAFVNKPPQAVSPQDVHAWRGQLEAQQLKPATVYARLSRLSSFYEWALGDARLKQLISANPVKLARPKAPRAYQSESARALSDEQLRALLAVVREQADAGKLIAKRDYAILLFFLLTGMRRAEVIGLRGRSLEERDGCLIVRNPVKGGDYVEREVRDPLARQALFDYLAAAARTQALQTDAPLWTRHDRAGQPGAPLTSHAFAYNLKLYARAAGIEHIHIHQTRHTYARIVAEESGSLSETQDALGHRNLATTRVYVQRIALKKDKFSEKISKRF